MDQDQGRQRHPTRVVARQMRALRRAREWSADDLAEAMRAHGIPWNRGVVAKLENGRREQITVDELLALCRVLDVALVHLLVPVDDEDQRYAVTPTDEPLSPRQVRDMIRGDWALPGMDVRRFGNHVPPHEFEPNSAGRIRAAVSEAKIQEVIDEGRKGRRRG